MLIAGLRRVAPVLTAGLACVGFLVVAQAEPAGADTVTFTSAGVGSSGTTASFNQSGPWTLSWTYSACSGGQSNFVVTVNQPPGDLANDDGVNQLGGGGSGTDYYYDAGRFSLGVVSECSWSITVSPSEAGSAGTPVTYTSSQTGQTGNPQEFSVVSPWTMSWSYGSCVGGSGHFFVDINQPPDLAVDIGPNELGSGGSGVDHYSDTGTFKLDIISGCAWSITINQASSPAPTPAPAPVSAAPAAVGMAATPDGGGYWIAFSDGSVHPHGDAPNIANNLSSQHLNAPITHIVATPDGQGYWLVASDGGTFSFGDAPFYGSMGGQHLNAPVVDMAPTPDGGGYWLVAADGGIFSFGDAQFHGSTGSLHLNKPVVGMAATPGGGGYWLVATDGGIFAFGNAPFYGSTGSINLNKPVNGMAATPNGLGYWMVASDGGIFNYGNAGFYGSTGSLHLNAPIVGMAATPAGNGYWLVGSDGGIFAENAPFFGAD